MGLTPRCNDDDEEETRDRVGDGCTTGTGDTGEDGLTGHGFWVRSRASVVGTRFACGALYKNCKNKILFYCLSNIQRNDRDTVREKILELVKTEAGESTLHELGINDSDEPLDILHRIL
ncbi:hypothetical protein SADUNF_Sadunf19G0044000 [Salix dunnii]|uniref:Uncharacterized protein n=1 Tax=Salix dunnii TaxID=1413687 RepID=A0A835MCD4_9ROSI|nr:hypothetical protein SADUNF_Sadunf19G0044000 [Salix dunnii]